MLGIHRYVVSASPDESDEGSIEDRLTWLETTAARKLDTNQTAALVEATRRVLWNLDKRVRELEAATKELHCREPRQTTAPQLASILERTRRITDHDNQLAALEAQMAALMTRLAPEKAPTVEATNGNPRLRLAGSTVAAESIERTHPIIAAADELAHEASAVATALRTGQQRHPGKLTELIQRYESLRRELAQQS